MTARDPSCWRLLSPLLDEALELPVSQRGAWLSRLALTQPSLLDELQSLLADHAASDATRFLTGAVTAPAEDTSLAGEGLAGQTLGAYTLESPIGRGGMGSVWLAQRSDGRFTGKVAVKLLNAALIGRTGGERFRREGRILAQLAHPNIAHLLDAGVTGAGQPYLVLEYVEGDSIDRHCDALRLDVTARVRLLLDVLAAVAHSHAHLVVHRDIKPMNVLVTADGTVKLLDFGIAKLLADETDADAALTRDGGRAMTPDYAAPEQLLGEPVTTATDVYALGVLLYLLLGGRHPCGDAAHSPAELMKTIVDDEPPRLSDVVASTRFTDPGSLAANAANRSSTPDRLKRLLQGDLDNIVAKAMKKRPAERYATVNGFADDLRRYLDDRPVSARRDTLAYRVRKFTRRHRAGVATGVLAGAAIVAGLVGTVTQASRAEAQALQARHDRDRALHQLSIAEASDEFVSFLLQEGADKPFTTSQLLARGEQLVDRQFAEDPALRARLLLTLANLYGEAMEPKKSQALLLRAQAAASGVADPSLHASVDCSLAERLGDDGAFDRAQPLFDGAITRLQADPEADRGTLVSCLNARSMVNSLHGDAKAGLVDAEAALAVLGVPRPGQRSTAVSVRTSAADAHGQLGDEARAVEGYQQAVAETNAMGRGHSLSAVTLYNQLGVHLAKAGQWLRATDAYRQGLTLAAEGDRADSISPALEANYAKLLVELGRTDEAKTFFERGLASALKRGHVRSIGPVSLLSAPAWCASGDLVRCDALLTAARANLQAILPAGHPMMGTLEMEEAQLAVARHLPVPARDHLRRALAIFDAATEKNPNRLRTLALLAETESQLGDVAEAAVHAAQAVAQARGALAGFTDSAWLGLALLAQGEVQTARGDVAAATATLVSARSQLNAALGDTAPATRQAAALLAAR